jgi:enoyl-CoA hydratase
MTDEIVAPQVRMSVQDHVCVISLDNPAKKNAITPEMMQQLSQHLTAFDDDDELWVAVLDPAGEHTTAGLDMPKFFGPGATARPIPPQQVDPLGLGRRCRKPVISVVHGITYTVGIEMMLAADIVIAADTARFHQLEAKRGIAPLGGAHFRYLQRMGWGNAMRARWRSAWCRRSIPTVPTASARSTSLAASAPVRPSACAPPRRRR